MNYEICKSLTVELAFELFDRTVLAEGCRGKGLVIHADNSPPQRSSTSRVILNELGLHTSYIRPRVSDNNAHGESLLETEKYRHYLPVVGFMDIENSRIWVISFIRWYNYDHRLSAIKIVTPIQRHVERDIDVLASHNAFYKQAKDQNPNRGSAQTPNWDGLDEIWLNPEKSTVK